MLDTLFTATNVLAMIGWAGLILLPGRQFVVRILARVLIPAVIAVIYIILMVSHAGSAPEGGGFGSLAGIATLFSVDALLLAGWIHYLAFDLFVGSWEVGDARKEGIPHLIVVPCLALTFLAGPAGLALYFAVKYARRALTSQPAQAGT